MSTIIARADSRPRSRFGLDRGRPTVRTRSGISLVEVVVVIAILATLVGLALPAVQAVRSAGQKARCQSNLRQLGIACQNYQSATGLLPAGAEPFPDPTAVSFLSYSQGWHLRLLPFVEQGPLFQSTMTAWAASPLEFFNPPHTGLGVVVPVYVCPAEAWTTGPGGAVTNYLGVAGVSMMSDEGTLFFRSEVRTTDIADGSSNTLFVGERPAAPGGYLSYWYGGWGDAPTLMGTAYLGVYEPTPLLSTSGSCPNRAYPFGPGSDSDPCSINHFWSRHTGGANFLFADGSVRFAPYWAADNLIPLSTRAGGEVSAPTF